jgi:hypothetical protein
VRSCDIDYVHEPNRCISIFRIFVDFVAQSRRTNCGGTYGGGTNTLAEHHAGDAQWVEGLCKNKWEVQLGLFVCF